MQIQNNVSSKSFNTFRANVHIDTLISIDTVEDFYQLKKLRNSGFRILGGGSNVLFTKDMHEPLVLINTKGIEVIKEEDSYVLVSIAAGEVWHDTVLWAIKQNYGGIENLSLIPGKCGAAPIQNIGAYGVEIKDVLHAVKAFNLETQIEQIFHNAECGFAYRMSHFKSKWKEQFLITDIILKLSKPNFHKINISYGAISSELEKKGITKPTIKNVSDAVIDIRSSKLPDPQVIGNAGSFFKNPIVDPDVYNSLAQDFSDMPNYPAGDKVKLAAGWLIDQCGWKGKRVGDTGTYDNQALVIVNRGEASGADILAVAQQIQKDVVNKFGIELEPEVNIW